MPLKLVKVPLKLVKKAAQAVRDGGRDQPAPVPRGRRSPEAPKDAPKQDAGQE